MLQLQARPLAADDFAPFGEVLTFDGGTARLVNDDRALRADTAARPEAVAGRPVVAIYRATGQALPLRMPTFEHHPHSTQCFVSVSAARFLVVVAPAAPDGLPDLGAALAFVGSAGEGVNYRPGVWHAPIVALGGDGDFLMFMWERGIPDDCIVHRPGPVEVLPPLPGQSRP